MSDDLSAYGYVATGTNSEIIEVVKDAKSIADIRTLKQTSYLH